MNTMVIESKQTHETEVGLEPSSGFAVTPQIEEIVESALAYLQAGYPIHFSGPAGTGKTTLAFHVASRLERPVTLIHGDDEFKTSDLIGKHDGYRKRKLYDNFIHSVVKSEEEMQSIWADNRLTSACRNGHVLIYDEFNPEDNAMMQALYSRSSKSVAEHVAKVKKTGSGKFMEQFYVGYGHLSIADCGSTTLFTEGLSMLADKAKGAERRKETMGKPLQGIIR